MYYFTTFIAVLTAFGLVSAAPASGDVDPNLIKQVSIKNVAMAGSGCPQGSVVGILSPDNTIMTLLFTAFEAEWSNTTQPNQEHENCQVIVEFGIPEGLTFWVTTIDHRGFANLGPSCTGVLNTLYYFSGQQSQATTNLEIKGPIEENYVKTDTAVGFAAVTCPCGTYGLLDINVGVSCSCTNHEDQAFMDVESEDQNWQQIYHLSFGTCH